MRYLTLNSTDYYPFGMPMPNRQIVNGEPYRYGYQGEFAETDPETGKPAFQLRLWDARIGRWLTTDPAGQFSSPYLGMGNNPIVGVDPDGAWVKGAGFWNNIFHSDKEIYMNDYGFTAQEAQTIIDGDVTPLQPVTVKGYSRETLRRMATDMLETHNFANDLRNMGMEVSVTNNRREAMNSNINFLTGLALPTGKLASTNLPQVLGKAQTTGTRGHGFVSRVIGFRYSIDPTVARVTYDLGYKRLLGGGAFKYGPRPDVGVLFKNGTVKIFEVSSKTDIVSKLISRNRLFMQANRIPGNVSVNNIAKHVNRYFPK